MRRFLELVLVNALAGMIILVLVVTEVFPAVGIYQVKKGDRLADLVSMLGKKNIEANNLTLEEGQKIRFYFDEESNKKTIKKIYSVKKGDTPEEIAAKLGVKKVMLLIWNPGMSCRYIYPGQEIHYQDQEKDVNIGTIILPSFDESFEKISKLISKSKSHLEFQLAYLTYLGKKENILIFANITLVFILGLSFFWFFWRYLRREDEEKEEKLEKNTEKTDSKKVLVEITINKKRYLCQTEMVGEGEKFASFHQNNEGNTLYFSDLTDLKKSLSKTLRDHQIIFKEKLANKELIPITKKEKGDKK